jgi:hypothetical protein
MALGSEPLRPTARELQRLRHGASAPAHRWPAIVSFLILCGTGASTSTLWLQAVDARDPIITYDACKVFFVGSASGSDVGLVVSQSSGARSGTCCLFRACTALTGLSCRR